MHRKKSLFFIAILSIMLLLCSGCGSKKEEKKQSDKGNSDKIEQQEPEKESTKKEEGELISDENELPIAPDNTKSSVTNHSKTDTSKSDASNAETSKSDVSNTDASKADTSDTDPSKSEDPKQEDKTKPVELPYVPF